MLANVPKEWLSSWLDHSPGGRVGETYELKGVSTVIDLTHANPALDWTFC